VTKSRHTKQPVDDITQTTTPSVQQSPKSSNDIWRLKHIWKK